MRNREREAVAKEAANAVRTITQLPFPFERDGDGPIGLELGTGWGDVLPVENPCRIPLVDIYNGPINPDSMVRYKNYAKYHTSSASNRP